MERGRCPEKAAQLLIQAIDDGCKTLVLLKPRLGRAQSIPLA